MKNNFLGEAPPKQHHSLTTRKNIILKNTPLPESSNLQAPGSMFNLMNVKPQHYDEKSPPAKGPVHNLTRTKPLNYI